jgi:hypothetical protein
MNVLKALLSAFISDSNFRNTSAVIEICLSSWYTKFYYKELFRNVSTHINLMEFNVYGSVHPKNILIYVQQDATLHSLFYLKTALYVSGGTTTHHQERKQLYLQHLVFFTL